MKFIIAVVGLCLSLAAQAGNPYLLVEEILPVLQGWGKDAVLVQAVKEQNNQKLTLDAIKARDAVWIKEKGIDAEMQAMMESDAAKQLQSMAASKSYLVELFLMDNQGANVAMTNKTSDYWQGDEAKWTNSFNDGKGGLEISDAKYDESVKADLIQVSVPVMDNGVAIGAITIGVNLDLLQSR